MRRTSFEWLSKSSAVESMMRATEKETNHVNEITRFPYDRSQDFLPVASVDDYYASLAIYLVFRFHYVRRRNTRRLMIFPLWKIRRLVRCRVAEYGIELKKGAWKLPDSHASMWLNGATARKCLTEYDDDNWIAKLSNFSWCTFVLLWSSIGNALI